MKRPLAQRLDELHPIHVGHSKVQQNRVERLQPPVKNVQALTPILGLRQLRHKWQWTSWPDSVRHSQASAKRTYSHTLGWSSIMVPT